MIFDFTSLLITTIFHNVFPGCTNRNFSKVLMSLGACIREPKTVELFHTYFSFLFGVSRNIFAYEMLGRKRKTSGVDFPNLPAGVFIFNVSNHLTLHQEIPIELIPDLMEFGN